MNRILRITVGVVSLSLAVFLASTPLLAQEGEMDATAKAEAEMKAALGTVPVMLEVYPEHLRAGAWEWFKATQSPDAAIPPKYAQLISLAVAAQIPCAYCVYAHATMAKSLGATEEELQGAIASAADTRHWSTVLNGNAVDLEDFKREWDGILAHMKEKSAGEEPGM